MNRIYLKIFLLLLCLAGLSSYAYAAPATLPFSFDGGFANVKKNLGMSQSGLEEDYGTPPYLKFDSEGDNLIINFKGTPEAPMYLSYKIKGWPSGGDLVSGTFNVLESANGTDYTPVKSYTNLSNVTATETYLLSSTSNYVKFVYTTKTKGNVAIGNISISSNYTRATTNGKYGTICLPADASATGATVYSASLNATKDALLLTEVSKMAAGTPYIYKATEDTQTFTCSGARISSPLASSPLVGVFSDTQLSAGTYVLQTQDGVQQFYVVSADDPITVSHYKAYVSVPSDAKALTLTLDDATAISDIDSPPVDKVAIYDLGGRRLTHLQKGINIVNGVKVVKLKR